MEETLTAANYVEESDTGGDLCAVWSEVQKKNHFTKFCNYQHNKEAPKTVTDKENLIEVSKTTGQVKRKENQND